MKRILCVFICILLFGGCSDGKTKDVEKEPLDFGGFECVVSTMVNDVEISAKAVYTPFDSLSFTFLQPETLNGTEIYCKSGEYTLRAGEMTLSLSSEKLPFDMICKALEGCLENVRGSLPATDASGTFCEYQKDGHNFRLFINPETKTFLKLSVDNTDLLFFESFTLAS